VLKDLNHPFQFVMRDKTVAGVVSLQRWSQRDETMASQRDKAWRHHACIRTNALQRRSRIFHEDLSRILSELSLQILNNKISLIELQLDTYGHLNVLLIGAWKDI